MLLAVLVFTEMPLERHRRATGNAPTAFIRYEAVNETTSFVEMVHRANRRVSLWPAERSARAVSLARKQVIPNRCHLQRRTCLKTNSVCGLRLKA